jgi:cytochrome c553
MFNSRTRRSIAAMLAYAVFGCLGGRALALDTVTPEQMVERALHVCNACHGEGGDSKVPINPKLAGQPALYLADQLRSFRSQKRADSSAQAYMWGISALLDEATIEGLAEFYAAQKPTPGKPAVTALMEKGQRIFNEGIPGRKVMACSSCHGEGGEGDSVFPRIAGQHADYIVKQLNEFRTKLRPHGAAMAERIVKHMEPEELRAVAAYLQAKNP